MTFEWDEAKNRLNMGKHGIDFEAAALVFQDPFLLVVPSAKELPNEKRFIALGSMSRGKLEPILVVFTVRDGAVRIISAHQPRPKFKKMYLANVYGPNN